MIKSQSTAIPRGLSASTSGQTSRELLVSSPASVVGDSKSSASGDQRRHKEGRPDIIDRVTRVDEPKSRVAMNGEPFIILGHTKDSGRSNRNRDKEYKRRAAVEIRHSSAACDHQSEGGVVESCRVSIGRVHVKRERERRKEERKKNKRRASHGSPRSRGTARFKRRPPSFSPSPSPSSLALWPRPALVVSRTALAWIFIWSIESIDWHWLWHSV